MLREYEMTIVASAQMPEDMSRQLFDKYESLMLADGGEIVRKMDWGVKKLAFPMKKQFRGRYMHYDLTGKPEHLQRAEHLMRIDDNVLRYMSIKLGDANFDLANRRAELAKQDAQIAAQKEAFSNAKEKYKL